ncbi:MAG: MFS transporter [Alphaproteobacteria bacterium]|nr:MFS transporter [Alphaproteobacteria bacterium]
MAQQTNEIVPIRTIVILAFSATAGVLVEFYDFFIFGYAAASAFPKVFFPGLPPTVALVLSYLTFGAGFPARLLGAFIFGHFGDHVSRKYSFVINILIVGAATVLTGLLPGYATLGLAAPILLVALRVVQGIGLGGEFGGASSLLAEFGAKRRHRAFWMSLANLGIPGGAMLASAVLFTLSGTFATTGWRVAMLLSAVIIVPALFARYKLTETPLFEQLKQRDQLAKLPSFDVLKRHARPVFLLALLSAFQQMDGYVSGTYTISFMKSAGIPLSTVAMIIFLSRIGDIAGVTLSGPFADIFKRKSVGYVAIVITTALSLPFVLAILQKQVLWVLVLQFFMTFFGIGLLHGLAPILTSESFPTRYRYSGTGIAYSLSAIFGGMIAPSLLAALIGHDVAGKWYFVPIVYLIYCVIAVVSLPFIRETRDLTLEQLDRDESMPENAAVARSPTRRA